MCCSAHPIKTCLKIKNPKPFSQDVELPSFPPALSTWDPHSHSTNAEAHASLAVCICPCRCHGERAKMTKKETEAFSSSTSFPPPFLLLHSITFKATQNSVPFQLNTTCQILELEGSHGNRSRAWVPAGKQKIRAKASPLEGLMQWTFLFLNLSCCVNELGVTQQRRRPELNPSHFSQVWNKTPPGFCFLHITPINSHSNRTTKQIQTEHAI